VGTSDFDFWGANGHRIVAQVCENHLSASAMSRIQEIAGDEYLAEIANWPDYIKSEKQWKFADSWHYTTVNTDQTIDEVKDFYNSDSSINDAFEAIELMMAVLRGDDEATAYFDQLIDKNKAGRLNDSTTATALAFLVHLVGDIHQPMHVGKNKDLGGNKITVLFFSEKTNIHAVWDTEIIEHERLSYTEFTKFIDKLSSSQVEEYQRQSMEEWALESIELREQIYNTIYDYTDRETGLPSFSWQYQHDFIPMVEERLLKAGVRLAGILNEIYE
jgi:hypothetical protein